MEDYLYEYNTVASCPISLVLFQNAIEHIARISRIISLPGGNALLVGVGGSGRKSLTRLSSFTVGYHLFRPELSKSYGITEWRNDLRKMLTTVGVESHPMVFLLDDPQIVSEAFLEDVDKILNTGEVPNLFSSEELIELSEALSRTAQFEGIVSITSPTDAYSYLVKKVQIANFLCHQVPAAHTTHCCVSYRHN